MSRRKWLWTVPVVGAAGLGVGADRLLSAGPENNEVKTVAALPVTKVVLFSSGVGYFGRSGEVEGDARVDLRFPEADVNDLLKSLTLQDMGGGRVAAVSYDSREPLARTLASFAVNLDGNPTLAAILDQTRGQPVEVVVVPNAGNQPGRVQGKVVGVEHQSGAGKDAAAVAVLNLWCADGLRSVKLSEVQSVRFADPALESEVRRALDELARSKDSAKKAVSLHFAGNGKREVRVGYVVEAPVWKTSYRLVLDPAGGSPYLQGWAVVENPTDEDWAGVKMALVSGRPISFRMDLYNPLYVPRPVVEPELFASLRPPTYDGGFGGGRWGEAGLPQQTRMADQNARNKVEADDSIAYAPPGLDKAEKGKAMLGREAGAAARFRGLNRAEEAEQLAERRKYADAVGQDMLKRMDLGSGVGSAATGTQLGDAFQYVIDHPVTLGRQKSALLPIVGKDIEAARVSIYNPAVQPKHPLLGLRLKNTTGLHLAQGPVTVFEGSTYAGDTRVLDVTPGADRLVSYALDLGTEVITQNGPGTSRLTSVKAVKGIVTTMTKVREERVYKIANKGQQDRTVLIEHPNRTNQQFKVVDTDKPTEETAAFLRFTVPVKAGEEKTFTVKEERDVRADVALSNSPDNQVRYFMSLSEATPALKAKLTEALGLKGTWDAQRRELQQVQADLARLNADQDRIRKNLRETPPQAAVYKVYLDKLSEQEKEIDALTAKQKQLMGAEFAAKKSFEDYLSQLSD